MWRWTSAGAALALTTGALPLGDARDVLLRVAPVLLFLAGVTALAELADGAGVFTVAAAAAARLGRGSTAGLFVLVALLATVTTAVLSLDTTAVLLTPVVLVLTERLDLPAAPFAVLTLWLANTASLLLPVSNLTNLLAVEHVAADGTPFAVLMAAPAVAVLGSTLLVVGGRYATRLRGGYDLPTAPVVADPVLFRTAVVVCAACGLLFAAGEALGIDAAVPATVGALALLVATALRGGRPGWHLLPWRLVVGTAGLFLLVQTALHLGLAHVLTQAAGAGSAPADLLQLTATAAAAANVANNLPAYLALEPDAAASPLRLAALLVGTNAGPLVLPWGSLATLLWLDRCRARGVQVPARELALLAVVGVPVVLLAGVLALAV